MSQSKATTNPHVLEMSLDSKTFGNNRHLIVNYMKDSCAHLSTLENYRLVAHLLLKKAGSKFDLTEMSMSTPLLISPSRGCARLYCRPPTATTFEGGP